MSARVPALAALAALCALLLFALLRAPDAWSPSAIDITLDAGQAIQLGQRELAAPQAGQAQLELSRGASGEWKLRNLDASRPIAMQAHGQDERTGRIALQPGMAFWLGAAHFKVHATAPDALVLEQGDRHWILDGSSIKTNGDTLPTCPDARLGQRLAAAWNRLAPDALRSRQVVSLGGNLHCGARLGIAHVASGSASLALLHGQWMLTANAGADTPLMLDTATGPAPLAQLPAALADVEQLTVGRTRYGVTVTGAQLHLRPQRHAALLSAPRADLPAGVAWTWQQRSLWLPSAPAPAVLWLAALLLIGIAAFNANALQRGRWPYAQKSAAMRDGLTANAALALCCAGVLAVAMQRAGTPLPAGPSALFGVLALFFWLHAAPRARLVDQAAVLLIGCGLLVQLELGLGAMESSWLRFFGKTTSLLAFGLGAGAFLRLRSRHVAGPNQRQLEWRLAILTVAALCALGLQLAIGDETGVFDLQPVEFAKLALSALAAHCLAVGLGWHGSTAKSGWRWLRLASPALLFVALLCTALVGVDDYSPLVLLATWTFCMALAFALATRRRWMTAAIFILALSGVGTIAALHHAEPDSLTRWGFYADRFLVWLAPAEHPHTGQQLLLGAQAIGEGDWFGADSAFGLVSLGQPAGMVLRIPAVQDDFAPSFFLNRHGLAAALVLWTLQCAFIAGLLLTAMRAWQASVAARDFRQAWSGRFRCFLLCGGAAFVFAQLLLSWGTNLSIFPVMGQPMSFLSAGGSHLLFFLCPLLIASAIGAQSFEENPSCRSMSNTKSWEK